MARGSGPGAAGGLTSESMASDAGFLALRDRAYSLVQAAGGSVAETDLLAHVYGGHAPAALRDRLAAPLLGDPRLERESDGRWSLTSARARSAQVALRGEAVTALALTTTGANPARGRVLRIAALHVIGTQVVERFSAVLNPGRRVPRYAAERAGHAPEGFEALPAFDDSLLDDLVRFLGERPVWAQEARHTWSFIEAEAHRLERSVARAVASRRQPSRLGRARARAQAQPGGGRPTAWGQLHAHRPAGRRSQGHLARPATTAGHG